MKNDKKPRNLRTVTTVKSHYIGTESMSAAFERALLIMHSRPYQPPDVQPDAEKH